MRRALWPIAVIAVGLVSSPVLGDGGSVRFHGVVGPYQVGVFTSPTPLRAGVVEVDVMIQDPATGRLQRNARVQVSARRAGESSQAVSAEQGGHSTNALYQTSRLEIPREGEWTLKISVAGPDSEETVESVESVESAGGASVVEVDVYVGPPPPPWTDLWAWIALPALPMAFYLLRWSGRSIPRRPKMATTVDFPGDFP